MATTPSLSASLDALIHGDEAAQPTGSAALAARDIASRAAWLAWQIEADEVIISEARGQLSGIAEALVRHGTRFPDDLREAAAKAFEEAEAAADAGNLLVIAAAAREIRAIMERHHKALNA